MLVTHGVPLSSARERRSLAREVQGFEGRPEGPFRSYRILHELGRGGFAVVYLAEPVNRTLGTKRIPDGNSGMREVYLEASNERVAVKVLHEKHSDDSDVLMRFNLEARTLRQLHHPNIVRSLYLREDVILMGQTDDVRPFFVMELLEGELLADKLMRGGAIGLENSIDIAIQLCRALGIVHAKKIVHRDVKPDNIFLVERNGNRAHVKLFDFSIAYFPEAYYDPDEAMGTHLYMAPEQIRAESVDPRTDVYTVGVVLFEMLTGQPPFLADTVDEVTNMHLREPPPLPRLVRPDLRIPEEIEQIILRALAKDPERRFQSMADFEAALEACRPVPISSLLL